MTNRRRTAVYLGALAAVALAAVLLARRAADAPAASDTAVIESYVRLASEGRLLVGAYSRFQWHHPGPLYFYLLAPFYLAAGAKTAGLDAGAAVLSSGAVLLTIAVLLRRQPRLAAIAAAALTVFAWRAAEVTASPWNPHVAVLPALALIVVAADVAAGTFAMLPFAVLLASVAGQAHVALMPCVLVVGLAAALPVAAAAARGPRSRSARRALAAAAVVLAASWALPVYEQLVGAPRGNLTELWRFFIGQTRHGQPFAVALSAWSDMLVGIVRPDFYPAHGWPFVESPVRWAEALSLVTVAAVGLCGALGWLRRDRFAAALGAMLLAAAGVALWSSTRIDERVFDHDVFWIAGIGLLMLAMVADAIVSMASRWQPTAGAAAAAVACALLLAAAGSARYLVQVVRGSFNPPRDAVVAGQLAADLQSYMAREQVVRPLIRIDQDAWPVAAGAILALQKQGRMTAVEEDWVVMFTPAFRANGREDAVVTVAAAAEHLRLREAGVPEVSAHAPVFAHARRVSGS